MSEPRLEGVDSFQVKYEELCRDLNMDRETEEASWNTFNEVTQRFSLEGDPIHWLCCALYSACRVSYTPTVGGPNAVVMGNCVSLNKLLRSCNMSISQFLTNIRKWHDMANLSSSFLSQIDRLERTFSITLNLFQRYNTIFEKLFLCPRNEKKKTKYRLAAKCSSNKLYDLCWCLYLCAKNANPSYAEEIIHSFHLLICCIDFIYLNVLAEKRVDLINPDFKGVPEKWNTAEFDINTVSSHCIIEPLCHLTSAIPEDSIQMKSNLWKNIIKEFFRTKTIYGNEVTFLGIVSNDYFERNLKSLNSTYEQFILSVGEFDERILLNNPNYRKPNNSDASDGNKFVQQEMKSLNPDTPYTRKHILPNKEMTSEPVTNATDNVKKLQEFAYITGPTDFIRQAGANIVNKVNDKLTIMREEFCTNHPNRVEAASRFELAKSLYFYLLEKIIRVEIRTKPNIDLNVLFEQETFNTTLIACCVEIVLDAYNSQLKFPWILECFSIYPFHFYKIIEIVVGRHENILTRALIKHLNSIEETCLDSLIWKKTSPLWEIYKVIPKPLPTWADVDVSNISNRHHSQLQSPMNSAYETFGSTNVSDSARRDLFNTSKESVKDKNAEVSKKIDGNKRAGSLPIFLRKFYKLAWIRIKELCNLLDMGTESFLNKIWTLFEYSIRQRTELMQDRHLDQILMCAIYIYIRVREVQDKPFTYIMKLYRKQPQAKSSIYREVLIGLNEKDEPTYGDIINFYNSIYIKKMSPYALNFSEKQKSQNELLLSPHPQENHAYPRKLTNNHPLTVQHMEKNEVLHSPNPITYAIGKSPAKELDVINKIVLLGKRNLPFDDICAVPEQKKTRTIPYDLNIIKGMVKDRQE